MSEDPRSANDMSKYELGYVVDGAYVLKGLLGRGGMGQVYRVEHLILKKEYALKILPGENVSTDQWQRFSQEARAIAKLNHDHIVKIHNMGIDSGSVPYYVMDLLTGTTLSAVCKKTDQTPLPELLDLLKQMAEALSYAHQRGIIHRDLKPSNIILVRDKHRLQAKLVDFGIAKLVGPAQHSAQFRTKAGEIFGTPLYMSPEQCLGQSCDERSDIYSLGCTFFEAIAKQPPFKGKTAMETIMLHGSAEPPSILELPQCQNYPESLDSLFKKMLAKVPEQRYQSMAELVHDLERLSNHNPIGKTSSSIRNSDKQYVIEPSKIAEEHTNSQSKKYKIPLAIAFLAVISAAAISTLFSYVDTSHSGRNTTISEKKKAAKTISQSSAEPELAALLENPKDIRISQDSGPIKSRFETGTTGKSKVIDFPSVPIGHFSFTNADGSLQLYRQAVSTKPVLVNSPLRLQVSPDSMVAFFHPDIYAKIDPALFSFLWVKGEPFETISFFPNSYLPKCSPYALKILNIASSWTNLETLVLEGVKLSEQDDLAFLDKMLGVRDLYFVDIKALPVQKLCDSKVFSKLEGLHLENCEDTDKLLSALALRSGIKRIYLTKTSLTNQIFAKLNDFKRLKLLEIEASNLSDTQLKQLAVLQNVEVKISELGLRQRLQGIKLNRR
ncbi:hypothetical protein BH11CYA1_BH11CYA1_42270 [soil metagenome]